MTQSDAWTPLGGLADCTAAELLAAVPAGDLLLHYQPIVELAGRTPVGVEALLRWRRPEALVAPGSFWHVVDAPTARELGRWVLDAACAQAASWRDAGLVDAVAVNVDPRELGPAWVADVHETLRRHALPTGALTLELTETARIDNPCAAELVAALVRRGVGIALDDAGTGFNALAAVTELPVTEIKIDRRFVARLGDCRADALIRALVNLARDTGMRTVAEGVETERQAQLLAELGVERAQGYLFSRPVPAASVAGYWLDALSPAERGVRLARGLHEQGSSTTTIAAMLNQRGIPSPRARRWCATTVEQVLNSVTVGAPAARHVAR